MKFSFRLSHLFPEFWTPFKLKNVFGVEISVSHIPESFGMKRIGEIMPNIETLYLQGFNLELVLSCKQLKNLSISLRRRNINSLLSILNSIENVKNLQQLYVYISVDAHHLTTTQTFSMIL